jgi:hypothetical protein
MSGSRTPADRRQFGRRQTSYHAWIHVPGRPKVPCMVRDLSVGGARLELVMPPWLPYNFQLTIEATQFTSMCEVRHSGPNSLGVRFMEAAASDYEPLRGADTRSSSAEECWMGDHRTPARRPGTTQSRT